MKKTYHLCLSAGDEVMFRDQEDYNRGFNCFALALYKTGSAGLVESFMATHTHQMVQTIKPEELMYHFRRPYSIYFNHKYQRNGKLGERVHFSMEVIGYHHLLAALSYAPIPYAYPHCSVNANFRKEMGKFNDDRILPRNLYYKHVGRRAEFPDTYKMNENGIFARESVLDIPQVENLFVTPRVFNYYMTRKSSEEWEREQTKDGNGLVPINLASIEDGVMIHKQNQMLVYENGKADYRRISDIELCTELDALAYNRYGRHSVYQMTLKEKEEVAEHLYKVRHISEPQIRRCLVLPKQ